MEFEGKHPLYIQIADYICENILLQIWEEKEKIPSKRELAVSIEVNPNTVMRTYLYLQERGIIFNQRGIGYFVGEDAIMKTRELKKNDFIKHDLPRFFKTMQMLQIGIDDLKPLYNDFVHTVESEEQI